MSRAPRHAAERATEREVTVVAAVLAVGSEKAAAHRLGLSHSTVKHHLANARSKVGATTTAQLSASSRPDPEDDRTTRHSSCAERAAREHRDKFGRIYLTRDRYVGAEAGVDQLTAR